MEKITQVYIGKTGVETARKNLIVTHQWEIGTTINI